MSSRTEPLVQQTGKSFEVGGSIPVGSVFGIPIRLHVLFFAALALSALNQIGNTWWHVLWAVVLFGPVLLLTITIHELGHCWATRKLGAEVHGILLWPLGGLAFVGHTASPRSDLLVALAGPATHLPQALAWLAALAVASQAAYGHVSLSLHDLYPSLHFGAALCAGALLMNLYLAGFNLLLPAYPLDGGRILADLLLMAGLGEVLAAQITVAAAVLIAAGIIVWGIMWKALITIAVGAWMLFSTWSLIQALRQGTIKQHPMFCYDHAQQGSGMLPNNHQSSAPV